MISKKQFCRYIDYLQKSEELENKLQDLFNDYSNVVSDIVVGNHVGDLYIVELLENIFGLKTDKSGYTDLSWWVYETKYGKENLVLELEYLPEDHRYRRPKLHKPEELYDYLVFLGSEENKKYCEEYDNANNDK